MDHTTYQQQLNTALANAEVPDRNAPQPARRTREQRIHRRYETMSLSEQIRDLDRRITRLEERYGIR